MIPYGRQSISQADIDAVVEVLKSDWLTQGPMVPKFENAVCEYVGAKHAVAVNSATSALHIACLALGVGPGDWVWTSPNTFVASANCALYCGAKVDFVDIDPNTYNLSISELKKKLLIAKKNNTLPKVIIPVHFAGQSCDMESIAKLAKEYGFQVIEDASHAIGGKYKNQPVGNCKYSDITVFSFHPVKIITTGEGGMALTNSSDLKEAMIRFRSHGITSKPELMESRPSDEIWNYQQIDLGFNYRMTDIQAALGLSQLKKVDEFIIKRHEIASRYDFELKSLPITSPYQDADTYSSYHLYSIRIPKKQSRINQREVYQSLLNSGIRVNLHYIPVYRQPFYQQLGFKKNHCPQSELYHQEAISIPLFSALTHNQQKFVIDCLKKIFD